MARWRERVPLESGLKLDINHLIREDVIRPGEHAIWCVSFRSSSGRIYDRASTVADMRPGRFPHLKIKHCGREQEISLCFAHRHFGGRQWYFTCPGTHEQVSVLWKPPGSPIFASRQFFGRQVAYGSQFETPRDRALSAARDIRRGIGGPDCISCIDPFPQKPKGMHWATYDRLQQKCEQYEGFSLAMAYASVRRLQTRIQK